MADKLFGVFLPTEHVVRDEVDQSESVRSVLELKIQSVPAVLWFNSDTLL